MDPIIQGAILLGGGALAILAGVAVNHILIALKARSTPPVQVILAALQVWALKAIIAGELTASAVLDETDRELDGLDKAAIANSLYNMLAGTIIIAGHSFDVVFIKHFITLEMWTAFVKQNFDEIDALVTGASDYLKKQIPPAVPVPDPVPLALALPTLDWQTMPVSTVTSVGSTLLSNPASGGTLPDPLVEGVG